jgi:hypothetical protein
VPHDDVTFGLALVGFAMLAADASRRFGGARSAALTVTTAAVVAAHVLCVWAFRFDWSLAAMLEKSLAAFVLFHGALLLLLLAAVAREPWRTRGVLAAFAIVCLGAVPAPFRYPELALLRLPVLAIPIAAAVCALRRRRHGGAT